MALWFRTPTLRYGRAVAGLGDPRADQRIGALHTLALLGDESPQLRPAVMDVIAAYLRSGGPDDVSRRTAARVLRLRLHPGQRTFWSGMSVDLSGAELPDLDLSRCRVDGDLRLDGCVFPGQARLRGLIVGGRLTARGACFADHAWLEHCVLHGTAVFDGATFGGDAWFGQAIFGGHASFAGASFDGHAWFGAASFGAGVDFGHAVFRRSAGFRGVVVQAEVGLAGTVFHGPARVSRRDDGWSLHAPGWRVVVDEDNEAVGRLWWVGRRDLIERRVLIDDMTPV